MNSRRKFLKGALAGAAGLGLSRLLPLRAQAGKNEGARKLVIALAYGGWDPMYALNPKPDSPEVNRIPGDVRMMGNIPIWAHSSRPNVTRFFEQWGSLSAVINGIAVESLAHEPCADVVLTGAIGGRRPDIGALLANHLGAERALPYLALGAQAKTNGFEALTGSLGESNQIMALSNPDFAWPAPGGVFADRGLAMDNTERDAVRTYLRESAQEFGAEASHSPRSARLAADYAQSLDRANRLQNAAATGGLLSDSALFDETNSRWPHVAAALSDGLSQVALVQPYMFWDTHTAHSTQGGLFNQFFGGLDQLMSELQARGILDETIVLVLSEMGRTPRHNSTGGKDHWPWTSAMLIGAPVRGNQTFGVTDQWLRPMPIDGETCLTIHAENILSTTAALMGISEQSWFEKEALGGLIA